MVGKSYPFQEIPSEADREGIYWIIHGVTTVSRQRYIEKHGISEYPTEDDLPETDNDVVRALDREALESREIGGKWNIFLPEEVVDEVWECVKLLVDEKEVFGAKVSTQWGHAMRGGDNYVIVVYTPNYLDVKDVFRVREVLRERCGVETTLYYKPDLYTKKGIYADTARDLGLPGASRFSG